MRPMDIQAFIKQFKGRRVDFDGGYGAQCVDIVKYWEQVNGWPVVSGNAKDVPKNAPRDRYQWIPKTMGATPKTGDIVVFDKGLFGAVGHIGICVSATLVSLTCFEQNNPIGAPCILIAHPLYRGVVGWLTPKTGGTVAYNVDAGNQIKNNANLNQFTRLEAERLVDALRMGLFGHIDQVGRDADVEYLMQQKYTGTDYAEADLVRRYMASDEFRQNWQHK